MSDTDSERLEETAFEVASSVSLASSSKVVCLDWNYCLCHTVESASSNPIIQFSHRSWEKLHEVLRVRGDVDPTYDFFCLENAVLQTILLEEATTVGVTKTTHEQTNVLRLLRRKLAESSPLKEAIPSSAQSRSDNTRHVRSAFPVTDYKFCIICQKIPANKNERNVVSFPVNWTPVPNRLTKAAQLHKDERLLLALQGDI